MPNTIQALKNVLLIYLGVLYHSSHAYNAGTWKRYQHLWTLFHLYRYNNFWNTRSRFSIVDQLTGNQKVKRKWVGYWKTFVVVEIGWCILMLFIMSMRFFSGPLDAGILISDIIRVQTRKRTNIEKSKLLRWTDAIDMSKLEHHSIDSSIILSTPPFHLHQHSSIASPLCRHHHSSRLIIDMIPPVTWGHKLTPRNVEQAYIESNSTILPQPSTWSRDAWGETTLLVLQSVLTVNCRYQLNKTTTCDAT